MRRQILEGADISAEIRRLIADAAADLASFSARVNKKFKTNILAVLPLDEDLVDEIGLLRKESDRVHLLRIAIEEAYANKELEIGSDTMRKVEREIYLRVLDALWMQHLENMQHLREGIGLRSIGQRDPLVEYRSESQKLFDGLQKNLREGVLRVLLTLTHQEVAADSTMTDQEYDSELTKMAESATEKGVNEISAGDKNLDSEFKPAAKATLARPAQLPHAQSKHKNKKKRKKSRK